MQTELYQQNAQRLKDRLPALNDLDDYDLANSDQDIRGRALRTRAGEPVGVIDELLVDRSRERVAALVLRDGYVVPVEEVEIVGDEVVIDSVPEDAAPVGAATGNEARIPIVEEEVAVGKRAVERGHIHVRSRVVQKPVHEEVRLREERAHVERRPVDATLTDAEADRLFQDRSVEVSEISEEAVVDKRARVKEEVVVEKEARERVEGIDETVRSTEVEVDDDTIPPKPKRH